MPARFVLPALSALLISGCGWLGNPTEKAATHLAAGDFASARIEASTAIAKDETDAKAYYILGQALLGQGDYATADRSLTRAADLGMDTARVDELRVRTLAKLRAYDRILAELQPDPRYEPGLRGLVLAARGKAHLATGNPAEARAAFEVALQAAPELPDARVGQAQLAYVERKPEEAMATIDRVLADSPRHASAWEFKAFLLRSRGDLKEALEALEQAASHDPASIEASVAAAEINLVLGDLAAAQGRLDAARSRWPDAVVIRHLQALLHFERKQYDEALSETQHVYKLAPEFLPAIVVEAATHLARGNLGQAAERLRTVIRVQPDHVLARRLYASTLLRQGNAAEALDVLRPDLEKPAPDPALLTLAAQAHVMSRDFSAAAVLYERAALSSPDRSGTLARAGVAKYLGGRHLDGLAILEQAAAVSGDDVTAEIALAMLHLQRKEAQRALAVAERLQPKMPANPIGFGIAGIASLMLNETDAARASFERATRIDPAYWPAAAHLARMDLAAGDKEAAKARIRQVLEHDANNVQSMLTLLQITGDRRGFVDSLETARRADPRAVAPRVVLVRAYLAQGLADRALPVAREILAAAPDRPEAMELLGTAQLAMGHASEALATFRELAAKAPKAPSGHAGIASALTALGDLSGAENAYRKAVELKPDDPEIKAGLARLYERRNRLDDALRMAFELQEDHPESAVGYALAGDLYFRARRYADAAGSYHAAFSRAPSGALLVARHVARSRAGARPDGSDLARWIEKNPADLTVRMHLADLFYVEGRYGEAAAHYEAILERDPNLAIVWNNLASAFLKLNDARALAAAESAHELRPDHASILDTLGAAQLHYGKPRAAVDTLKQAVSRRPDSLETRLNYARALVRAGDKDAARAELRKLTQTEPVALDAELSALMRQR